MLATCFATKMIRRYGLLQHEGHAYILQGISRTHLLSLPPVRLEKVRNDDENSRRLHEMAHFLETIRDLQYRISSNFTRPGQALVRCFRILFGYYCLHLITKHFIAVMQVDGREASSLVDMDLAQDEYQLSIRSGDAVSSQMQNQFEVSFPVPSGSNNTPNLALMPVDVECHLAPDDLSDVSALVPHGVVLERKILPLENPKEMIARWRLDNLDLKTVVKDALLSGRLPLAVLQLHLQQSRGLVSDEEPTDTFTEVRDIGRAIAYDLFLKVAYYGLRSKHQSFII